VGLEKVAPPKTPKKGVLKQREPEKVYPPGVRSWIAEQGCKLEDKGPAKDCPTPEKGTSKEQKGPEKDCPPAKKRGSSQRLNPARRAKLWNMRRVPTSEDEEALQGLQQAAKHGAEYDSFVVPIEREEEVTQPSDSIPPMLAMLTVLVTFLISGMRGAFGYGDTSGYTLTLTGVCTCFALLAKGAFYLGNSDEYRKQVFVMCTALCALVAVVGGADALVEKGMAFVAIWLFYRSLDIPYCEPPLRNVAEEIENMAKESSVDEEFLAFLILEASFTPRTVATAKDLKFRALNWIRSNRKGWNGKTVCMQLARGLALAMQMNMVEEIAMKSWSENLHGMWGMFNWNKTGLTPPHLFNDVALQATRKAYEGFASMPKA
jgi:hypothetical protein